MNTFGRLFRISIFGESHGNCVGVLIDGCPAALALSVEDFSVDLERRKSGRSGTTARREKDVPSITTGIFNGRTTGAPVLILFENKDTDSDAYEGIRLTPRPGHADFVAAQKFGGFNDYRGGGTFSGRLTAALVAAGVVAKKLLHPVSVDAQLTEVGGSIYSHGEARGNISSEHGEREGEARTALPGEGATQVPLMDIEPAIEKAIRMHDSVGGIVECRVKALPVGLGEPFFDSVESLLSHLIFSIPGIKGIEFGAGFACGRMSGSEYNDEIISMTGETRTNNAGGINGGITNGNELVFRVAVKPTSSISKAQTTIDMKTGKACELSVKGRHDTCIALRVPVIVEAATAVVMADLMLAKQKIPRILR